MKSAVFGQNLKTITESFLKITENIFPNKTKQNKQKTKNRRTKTKTKVRFFFGDFSDFNMVILPLERKENTFKKCPDRPNLLGRSVLP